MTRAVLIIVIVLTSACDGASSKLFVANNLARLSDYQLFEGLPYGAGERQTLDVYRPAKDKGKPAATVIFSMAAAGDSARFSLKKTMLLLPRLWRVKAMSLLSQTTASIPM